MKRLLVLLALAVATLASPAVAATFEVDRDHSSVGFVVRHLFTNVRGRFDAFSGTIEFDAAKPEATKVEGSIDAASINTNVAKRDDHLRSDDFFDVAKHPKITFTSTRVTAVDADKRAGKLEGTLTIKGVSKPVILDVEFLGQATDPWGNQVSSFSATTKINRKDFDLGWNQALETGGVLVGEEVTIEINAAAKPKK